MVVIGGTIEFDATRGKQKPSEECSAGRLGFHAVLLSFKLGGVMAELKKVVHVMRRFVPERWGGTESVVFNVSQELLRRGIESPIHCTAMLGRPGRDQMSSVSIDRHRYVFPWLGLSAAARQALRLKGGSPLSLALFIGLLREKEISIIHTHVQHRLGGMARTAARLKGVPYVVSLHGGCFTLPQEQIDSMTAPFAGKLEWGRIFGALFGSRRVLADAAGIICVGRSEYEEVRQRFPHKPVFLVPNGVDVSRFEAADGAAFRAFWGFNASERLVLSVSRFDVQKNQLGLVRAFARFAKAHPDHRLVLVGPVSVEHYYHEVLAEIGRLGLSDRVTIIEGLRPDDPLLASAYKAAEMFVLASVHEPFGIVVLEAWAGGVPVLAHRVGGIPGFAEDRKTALLVNPDSEDELVAGMNELASSETLREKLSQQALKEVRATYDWPIIAGRICEIYERMVAEC
jgi:glycosyltransferase involved in cell wall biosynthesis